MPSNLGTVLTELYRTCQSFLLFLLVVAFFRLIVVLKTHFAREAVLTGRIMDKMRKKSVYTATTSTVEL